VAGFLATEPSGRPAVFVASILFSILGNGAATRAGTVIGFLWFAFVGVRLVQKGSQASAPAEP
jgi:hypothetical protein